MAIAQVQIAPFSNLPSQHTEETLQRPEFAQFRDERPIISKICDLTASLFKDLRFAIRYRHFSKK